MPLITITIHPTIPPYFTQPGRPDWDAVATAIRQDFGYHLLEGIMSHKDELNLDPNTVRSAVQIMYATFDDDGINLPDVWVTLQFSEPKSEDVEVIDRIRRTANTIVREWFDTCDFSIPNIVLDLFWVPSHGIGSVDGVEFSW